MDIVINRRPVSIPVLPVIALVLLCIVAFTMVRVGRIQANEIGVFVNNLSGDISVEPQPGATVYNGWLTDFYVLDNVEQSFRMAEGGLNDAVNIKTRDGADVILDVAINYKLTSEIAIIESRVIPECGLDKLPAVIPGPDGFPEISRLDAYKVKWVRDFARSVIRYKFGELIPKEIYNAEQRAAKAIESLQELNRLLNPHGIQVTQVVPEQYRFYTEYEDIIDSTKAADQEERTQSTLAEAAIEEQKREETKATAEKNVSIARLQGELRQAMLEVEADAAKAEQEAQAYAYSTTTAADADFYKAKNEAESILALAKAKAQGMKRLAESLTGDGAANLVKLRYAEALKRATISGVPYAVDPRIQKVELTTKEEGQ